MHRAVKTDIKNADTIRYDTDNIGIADIIDNTDTIEPSLVSRTYF